MYEAILTRYEECYETFQYSLHLGTVAPLGISNTISSVGLIEGKTIHITFSTVL